MNDELADGRRHLFDHGSDVSGQGGGGGSQSEWGIERRSPRRRPARGVHAVSEREAEVEAGEIGLHRDSLGLDGLAERRLGDGDDARSRQRTEQNGVGLGTVLARQDQRVEGDEAMGGGLGRALQGFLGIDRAARGDLLVDRQQPMRGRDHRRARGRDEAELDHAPDFHELRRHQHVERPRHRVEREGRLLGAALRVELDIVRGGARALRHAGDRGAVGGKAVEQRGVHDPLREHAAPLPAHRGDQQRQDCWSG